MLRNVHEIYGLRIDLIKPGMYFYSKDCQKPRFDIEYITHR